MSTYEIHIWTFIDLFEMQFAVFESNSLGLSYSLNIMLQLAVVAEIMLLKLCHFHLQSSTAGCSTLKSELRSGRPRYSYNAGSAGIVRGIGYPTCSGVDMFCQANDIGAFVNDQSSG